MRLSDDIWGVRTTGDAIPAEVESIAALQGELMRARAKFPGNRLLLAALVEEVGELARAFLQRKPRSEIEREAIQVAAVALRIYEEGDSTFVNVTDAESLP